MPGEYREGEMPEDKDKVEGEIEGGEGGQGQTGEGGETPTIADFESWLKEQPAEVQAAYSGQVSSLKGALEAERAERKKLEKERKGQAKAADEAEAKRLEEQQEWEALAQKRAERISALEGTVAELEPLQERLERYEGVLGQYLERSRQGVPEHLIPLLDQMDVADQLAYLTEHADELKGAPAGVPATPRPQGNGQVPDDERRKKAVGIRQIW
jgi:molecular chaperone GrpE (heat shock protein)